MRDVFHPLRLPSSSFRIPFEDLGFATQDRSWCAFIGALKKNDLATVASVIRTQTLVNN
jgi:hypothetical protein